MKRAFLITCGLLLASSLGAQAGSSQSVVDNLAAVVDGQPIFASEVRDAAWYARFSAALAGAKPDSAPLTAAEQNQALSHLEDEALLAEARTNEGFAPPPDALLQARADAQWQVWETQSGGAAALTAMLAACRLGRADVLGIVKRQLSLVAYLNEHFSGDAAPAEAAIQHYYDSTFVPEARARGLQPAPIGAVQATIATLLRQQQRAAEEQALLTQLRAQAKVQTESAW